MKPPRARAPRGFALLAVLVLLLLVMLLGQSSLTVARAAMREAANDDRLGHAVVRAESVMDAVLVHFPATAPLSPGQQRCAGAAPKCQGEPLSGLPAPVADWVDAGTAGVRIHRPVRAALPPPGGAWSLLNFQAVALEIEVTARDDDLAEARAAARAGLVVVTARNIQPPTAP